MDVDKCINTEIGNVRIGENLEEARSLSPIEEESEITSFFKEIPSNFTISDQEEIICDNVTRSPYKEREKMSRKMEGDSSSGDEQVQSNRQLRGVKGSYCCFKPEAEASGDNDEAELGLRDKSLKTTVEQLQRRLSQAEREIVALKRYRSPQKCQSHERCEILRRDLLSWRDDHEKRINSQIVSWQLTEQKRIHDEMENVRKVYDTIHHHLEALERQSARSYFDFRRQIDVWEKRFKEDIVSLHDNDLMELREQLKAWCEMQTAVILSRVRKEKCEACESRNNTVEIQDEVFFESRESEMAMLPEDKFLRKMQHVIKFEVQQHRDDLVKRMNYKIMQLWSAFEDFKHNFHLNREYYRRDCIDTDNDDAESIKTENL